MANFTRKIWTRNEDGMTVIIGTLLDEKTLQYEVYDKEAKGPVLKKVTLTGPVVETESNKIVVIGKFVSEEVFELATTSKKNVTQGAMYAIPEDGGLMFKVSCTNNGEDTSVWFLSTDTFKSAYETEAKESGKKYHKVKLAGGTEASTIVLNCFNFRENKNNKNERYNFVLVGELKPSKSSFETDNGTCEWTTYYAFAVAQLV